MHEDEIEARLSTLEQRMERLEEQSASERAATVAEFNSLRDTVEERLAAAHMYSSAQSDAIAGMARSLRTVAGRLQSLEANVMQLRADMTEVKGDVAILKTDVSGLKTDMTEVKATLSDHSEQLTTINTKLDQLISTSN